MTKRTAAQRVTIWLTLAAFFASAFWIWDHRHYWIDHNTREIEAQRIYCGGYQYPGPLRRMLRDRNIKTVLSLRHEGSDLDDLEQQEVESAGTNFVRIAVPHGPSMRNKLKVIRKAAEFIHDENNQPVYFHCWGGKHRAGAVLAIYRVAYCGWTEQEALNELEDNKGCTVHWTSVVVHRFCSLRGKQ